MRTARTTSALGCMSTLEPCRHYDVMGLLSNASIRKYCQQRGFPTAALLWVRLCHVYRHTVYALHTDNYVVSGFLCQLLVVDEHGFTNRTSVLSEESCLSKSVENWMLVGLQNSVTWYWDVLVMERVGFVASFYVTTDYWLIASASIPSIEHEKTNLVQWCS